jgi:PAS domain S-box-containing protein
MDSRSTPLDSRFFDLSADLLCMLDFGGRFKRLNPIWERTLGFTRQELMARPFIEFVHPDDRKRTLLQNSQVRRGGQALGFENRYLCKDDSYRWFVWNAVPDAEARTVYSVARDITAERRAQEERERQIAALSDALAGLKDASGLCVCSYCMKLRDEDETWHRVDHFIARRAGIQLSHGICPTCMESKVEPQIAQLEHR